MTRWVAMVQREVGERFAAKPGSDAYGVPSVLAQLVCDVKVLRSVAAQRLPPGPERRLRPARAGAHGPARGRAGAQGRAGRVRAPAQGARRARCEMSGVAKRDDARAALRAIGLDEGIRAERLSPDDFRRLAEAL